MGLIQRPVGELTPIEGRDLNEDFCYYHRLLECHTCRYVDHDRLFRGPCCMNTDRIKFQISGHNAETDGRCPSHMAMDAAIQQKLEKVYREVYDYEKATR